MLPYIEKVISLLSIGFITVVLNLIEVVIIAKEGHGRSLLETTSLSLGFADLFVGIAVILSGTCYLLPSSVSPDLDQILYASLVIIFPMSFWACWNIFSSLLPNSPSAFYSEEEEFNNWSFDFMAQLSPHLSSTLLSDRSFHVFVTCSSIHRNWNYDNHLLTYSKEADWTERAKEAFQRYQDNIVLQLECKLQDSEHSCSQFGIDSCLPSSLYTSLDGYKHNFTNAMESRYLRSLWCSTWVYTATKFLVRSIDILFGDFL